jgi:hypothetical protein
VQRHHVEREAHQPIPLLPTSGCSAHSIWRVSTDGSALVRSRCRADERAFTVTRR